MGKNFFKQDCYPRSRHQEKSISEEPLPKARVFEVNSITPHSRLLLLDFSLTVKAATLIFISGCGSAILSAKEGNSGFIYNLVNS